ncbi:hypothetical protein PUN28_008532 [Cardiocondyla obscurior]|uniref:Transmembrane protein n=1 Tax=Cardiocondyla obscurior TaxID=286306 RepID=A0AAW2G033_9HYME
MGQVRSVPVPVKKSGATKRNSDGLREKKRERKRAVEAEGEKETAKGKGREGRWNAMRNARVSVRATRAHVGPPPPRTTGLVAWYASRGHLRPILPRSRFLSLSLSLFLFFTLPLYLSLLSALSIRFPLALLSDRNVCMRADGRVRARACASWKRTASFCLCGCMGDSGERRSPGQRFFQMLNARFVPTHTVCPCYVASTGSPGTSQRTRQTGVDRRHPFRNPGAVWVCFSHTDRPFFCAARYWYWSVPVSSATWRQYVRV